MATKRLISIVVPFYNEEEVLPVFCEALFGVPQLNGMGEYRFEFVLVDDGSTDRTLSLLEGLARGREDVTVVSFTRNFGHQAALLAGLREARGDCVITMDGDMQHPPELVPHMIQLWEAGHAVVQMTRKDAMGTGLLKRLSSSAYYWLLSHVMGVRISPNASDFRLLDRAVVDRILELPERKKFLRALVYWMTEDIIEVPYHAGSRAAGSSRYSLQKMVSLGIEGITSFSVIPLRLASLLGACTLVGTFAYAVYILLVKVRGSAVPGWASTVLLIALLGGVQFIVLGIIGEYLAAVYDEVKGRPAYVVKSRFTDESGSA